MRTGPQSAASGGNINFLAGRSNLVVENRQEGMI